jgi:hypothetical protein
MRNEASSVNYSKWIFKRITGNTQGDRPVVSSVKYGKSFSKNKELPRQYSAVSETISGFQTNVKFPGDTVVTDSWAFNFNYGAMETFFSSTSIADVYIKAIKKDLVPVAIHIGGGAILAMDYVGTVFVLYSETIRNVNAGEMKSVGPLISFIEPDSVSGPTEYSEFSILNKRMPLGLGLAYLFGLDNFLRMLGLSYTLVPTNVRLPPNHNQFKLKFKDIVYVITAKRPHERLIVGGFVAIKNVLGSYRGSDFNKQTAYIGILSGLGITGYHLRELKLMVDLFIDPITLSLLEKNNEPTETVDLLIKANQLLTTDYIPQENIVRYKGYERICGMVYAQLVNSIRTFRSKGAMSNSGVSMNPYAVWLDILQDQSIVLVEESNPIHNLKELESFTHSGAGGRSAVTMVKNTRGYRQEDLGVISEATVDSSKTALRASLTYNPLFTSLLGETREFNKDTDGASNAVSTSILLSAGATHDD